MVGLRDLWKDIVFPIEIEQAKKPYSTYDFKGTCRVPISNVGGGKNDKARWTVILGATSEG